MPLLIRPMQRTRSQLSECAFERMRAMGSCTRGLIESSLEIVVFGSMSAGLERPDSDVDVLCVAGREHKIKSEKLDLIVCSLEATQNPMWLESELVSHIAEYGTWIKGSPRWKNKARIGEMCIYEKRRRVMAFMKALPATWSRLNGQFQTKYSIKLRRETQRLILLELGVPVPPTRILDCFWENISRSKGEVHDRLRQLTTDSESVFFRDLRARIDAHFSIRQDFPL